MILIERRVAMQDMFCMRLCDQTHLEEILTIQEEAIAALPQPHLLNRNTPQLFETVLTAPNVTVGAFDGERLAGFASLFHPQTHEDDLSHTLETVDVSGKKVANYKVTIVRETYRGHRLQQRMEQELERYAKEQGVQILCVTVSPDNLPNKRNIEKCGYTYDHTQIKYGNLLRDIYYKVL